MLTIMLYTLLVSVVHGQVSDDCDTHHMSYRKHGLIVSENFPFNYKNDRDCRHTIYLDYTQGQPNNRTICLKFYRFALENVGGCWNDYLSFGGVNYCGPGYKASQTPSQINKEGPATVWEEPFCWPAPGDKFIIQFNSNSIENERGYYMTYEIFPNMNTNRVTTTTTLKPSTSTFSAIDNIQLDEIDVNETVANDAVSVRATTTTTTTTTRKSKQTTMSLTNQASCDLSSEYTCFNRRCVLLEQKCDYRDNCGDLSDEQYYHARCPDTIGLEACNFDMSETHKRFCHFELNQGWKRDTYSHYGPKFDHTEGLLTHAYFVYTEFTDTMSEARLEYKQLPKMLDVTVPHCLSFWYFMYGYMGFLNLTIGLSHETREWSSQQAVWFRIGDHGNQWRQGEVLIPEGMKRITQLEFRAIEADTNWHQNFALDDISMKSGNCIGGDISCTFELSMCEWTTESEGDPSWHRHKGPTNTPNTGPDSDYDGDGYYAFMNSTAYQKDTTVRMISREYSYSYKSFKCFSLAYYMYGTTVNFLIVRYKHYDGTETLLFSTHGNKGRKWNIHRILLQQLSGPFQIVIEAVRGADQYSDIAVDNLELKEGRCADDIELPPQPTSAFPVPTTCPPEYFQCSDMTCIEEKYRCDGRFDCYDRSDEDNCNLYGGSGLSTGAIIGVAVGLCVVILIIMINVVICNRRRQIQWRRQNPRRPYITSDTRPDPDSSYADFTAGGGLYDQPPPYSSYANPSYSQTPHGSPPPQYVGGPPEYSTFERSPPTGANMSTVTISFQCPGDPPPSYDIAIVASPSRGSSIGALNQIMQRESTAEQETTNEDLSQASPVSTEQQPSPANIDHSTRNPGRGLPKRYRRHGAASSSGSRMRMASQPNLNNLDMDQSESSSRALSHPNLSGAADLLPTSLQPENPLLACQASRMYSQPNMSQIHRDAPVTRASQPNLSSVSYSQRHPRTMSSQPNLSVQDNINSRLNDGQRLNEGHLARQSSQSEIRDTMERSPPQQGSNKTNRRIVPPWKKSKQPVSGRSLSMPQLVEEPTSEVDITQSPRTMRTASSMRDLVPSSVLQASGETSV